MLPCDQGLPRSPRLSDLRWPLYVVIAWLCMAGSTTVCSSSGQRGDFGLRGNRVAASGRSNGHGLLKEVPKGLEMSMCWLNADHYKEFKQENGFK